MGHIDWKTSCISIQHEQHRRMTQDAKRLGMSLSQFVRSLHDTWTAAKQQKIERALDQEANAKS